MLRITPPFESTKKNNDKNKKKKMAPTSSLHTVANNTS
tara:strand:- start:476 stop:589 length:114 start_codon:yes stop_codon:yes gene_type:complete